MKRGVCNLCGSETDLQETHIVPEFFYQRMYGPDRRFFQISSDPSHPEKRPRKGKWEYLLCRDCDGPKGFGRYDDYAAKVFKGGIRLETSDTRIGLSIKGLDYRLLKLFFLSLLWRMHIATDSLWKEVRLGPFEAKIKQRLIEKSPGPEMEFPCLLVAIRIEGDLHSWTQTVEKLRSSQGTSYRAIIDGILFHYWVAKSDPPKELRPFYLSESGEMYVLLDDMERMPFLQSSLSVWARASSIRERNFPKN